MLQILNIRANEWPRVRLLYLMIVVFMLGWTWSSSIFEALFLAQIGVQFLPWFFVVKALLSVPAIAIYTRFADYKANDAILMAILAISATGLMIGLLFMYLGFITVAYPLLYLILFIPLDDIFWVHWYTFASDFFTTRSARRILPVLSTAIIVGGGIAGFSMPLLSQVDPKVMVFIWLCTLMLTVVGVRSMTAFRAGKPARETDRRQLAADGGQSSMVGGQHPAPLVQRKRYAYLHDMLTGYRSIWHSALLRWIAIATLLVAPLLALIEYQTSQIMLDNLQTPASIANFTGLVIGVSNLVLLPFQLFGLSRIIGAVGVGNANLIFPLGNLVICAGLIMLPGIPMAALAYFDRARFYGSVGYLTDNLLYNAVPLRMSGRARAFIGGLLFPLGFLIGSGLLLGVQRLDMLWLIPLMIGVLAVCYCVSTLLIRNHYQQALILMLAEADYSPLLTPAPVTLHAVDPQTLQGLKQKLHTQSSDEFTIFIAQLIKQVGGSEAGLILATAARNTQNAHVRSALLDLLATTDVQEAAIRQLFTDFLHDSSAIVRQSALNGLAEVYAAHDTVYLALMFAVLNDSDRAVRAQALPPLLRSGIALYRDAALQEVHALLTSAHVDQRIWAIQALGQVHDSQLIALLIDALADPADAVRLAAAVTLEDLALNGLSETGMVSLLAHLRRLIHDPVERVRQAAITILPQIGGPATCSLLLHALADPSRHVRTSAVSALVQAGPAVVSHVQPHLAAANPQLRLLSAVVLGHIDRQHAGPYVLEAIKSHFQHIYQAQAQLQALVPYARYPSVTLIQQALHEYCQQLLADIFDGLGTLQHTHNMQIAIEALHSPDAYVRANAVEALETMTTPWIARLVEPLFDPHMTREDLIPICKATWNMDLPGTVAVIEQLLTDGDSSWNRAMMTFALGELGAGLTLLNPTDLTRAAITQMLQRSATDRVADVRLAARAAQRLLQSLPITALTDKEEDVLSLIERVTCLKEVSFFQGMGIEQLKILATACEEHFFPKDAPIFHQGDTGGTLYVIVTGRVAIEQEKRKGSFARLATLEAYAYCGEDSLFDGSQHMASAIALQDTLTLQLHREPVVALIRQHPELSLELIYVLSQRLREAHMQIGKLTRTMPRQLQQLFDEYE